MKVPAVILCFAMLAGAASVATAESYARLLQAVQDACAKKDPVVLAGIGQRFDNLSFLSFSNRFRTQEVKAVRFESFDLAELKATYRRKHVWLPDFANLLTNPAVTKCIGIEWQNAWTNTPDFTRLYFCEQGGQYVRSSPVLVQAGPPLIDPHQSFVGFPVNASTNRAFLFVQARSLEDSVNYPLNSLPKRPTVTPFASTTPSCGNSTICPRSGNGSVVNSMTVFSNR